MVVYTVTQDLRHSLPTTLTTTKPRRITNTSNMGIFHELLVTFCQTTLIFDAHCCHMGTAMKHLVPDRVKSSFAFFDIRAL